MAPFRDQVAVITDVCRGMGRAHALRLARDGAAVVLVNIAPMWEITDEQWDDVVDVNLNGVWHAVKPVAPAMIHQRSVAIVLVSPANGIEPGKRFAHCTAARHGVLGLMKALVSAPARYVTGSAIAVDAGHLLIPGYVG
jgi:NAD(P)-dependent dehydrogenase (short-subunit alcohol dehydrogenase family)